MFNCIVTERVQFSLANDEKMILNFLYGDDIYDAGVSDRFDTRDD